MINFSQQFCVLEVTILTKPPGLGLRTTGTCVHVCAFHCVIHARTIRPWLQNDPFGLYQQTSRIGFPSKFDI
jgi:hypothetical protein